MKTQPLSLIAEANALVDAWESLTGGRNQNVRVVEAWLMDDMKPAIDALREALGRPIPQVT